MKSVAQIHFSPCESGIDVICLCLCCFITLAFGSLAWIRAGSSSSCLFAQWNVLASDVYVDSCFTWNPLSWRMLENWYNYLANFLWLTVFTLLSHLACRCEEHRAVWSRAAERGAELHLTALNQDLHSPLELHTLQLWTGIRSEPSGHPPSAISSEQSESWTSAPCQGERPGTDKAGFGTGTAWNDEMFSTGKHSYDAVQSTANTLYPSTHLYCICILAQFKTTVLYYFHVFNSQYVLGLYHCYYHKILFYILLIRL